MVPDGGGNHQRAYKAWGRQKLKSAKLEEQWHVQREDKASEVAKSAITDAGKTSTPAPTAIAPSREMPMPRSFDEALNCRAYGPQWAEALAKELAGFEAQHCFETVKLEAYMKPLLSLKPIFKVKFHSDGSLDKFKVRLVVGGHKAIIGQHFEETYSGSPLLSLVILRLILAVFAEWPHVKTTVADAIQAYLNSDLEEEVHVRAPKGMAVPPGYVLKVLKAIYGLPQGGRNFWKLLRKVILSLGFT
jgi:hypothetical protein